MILKEDGIEWQLQKREKLMRLQICSINILSSKGLMYEINKVHLNNN